MYTAFFGLAEKPFSITPDPRYLYLSERHAEALAHLVYGVKESGGFIQLTGEVGTGKTTLVRSLLEQLPSTAQVAVVLNPQLSRSEFLSAICEELRVPLPEQKGSIKALTDALNAVLLKNHSEGRRTVLIVDEAQNLRVEVLEQVRLLTNLETAKQKLLQIILIGQEELRDLLSRNDMRQLAQRITGRYHLEPLSAEEAIAYVDHRLRVAGAVGPIFTAAAKRELYRLSGGVPRMINVIADRALLGAYTIEQHQVTPELVRQAASEVYDRRPSVRAREWWHRPPVMAGLGAAAAVILLASAWAGMNWIRGRDAAPQPVAVLAAAPAADDPAAVVAETPPAASPRDLVALEPLLRSAGAGTGTDAAFRSLFRRWGVDYQPGPRRACLQAEDQGLHCLYQRGTLEQVQSLGRPVILTLRDSSSNPHQVTLVGVGPGVAVIDIQGREYRVPERDLKEYWFGEYLLLWRPLTREVKSFFPGMRDPDVKWLRESLAAIQGRPVEPMGSDTYDDSLTARVRDYQRARKLPVDGLAGHATQVAISADLGGDDPRLARVN
jgi:general secretion pathway protein A